MTKTLEKKETKKGSTVEGILIVLGIVGIFKSSPYQTPEERVLLFMSLCFLLLALFINLRRK